MEKIDWVKFAETEDEGIFYQVRVTAKDGGLLWEGPKVADIENPLVFGDWHFGLSLPDLAADIDGDGIVEMLTPAPQSDVSPTYFRVLRWKGGRFVPAPSGLLLESPKGSGKYPWSNGEDFQGRWISAFKKVEPDGSLRVEVFEYMGGASVRVGEALVVVTAGGFEVKSWPVPMKVLTDMPSPEPSNPPLKGGVVVYRARLSAVDHLNSAGVRLDKVADILRQDRANYYKGKGDADDGPDPLFRTLSARNGMDTRKAVPVGSRDAEWRSSITKGTPLVEVEVTDSALRVKIIEP